MPDPVVRIGHMRVGVAQGPVLVQVAVCPLGHHVVGVGVFVVFHQVHHHAGHHEGAPR